MLYEVIKHENNCKILCYAVRSHKRMMHYHREIEILYALQGEIQTVYNGRQRTLHPHDIVILESDTLHDVYSSAPSNSLLVLQIQPVFFTEFCPALSDIRFQKHFLVPSDGEVYQKLRAYLADIVERYPCASSSRSFHLIRIVCDILILLMERLRLDPPRENGSKVDELSLRISRIIRYIDDNHSAPISLKEIAHREGVSFYYLSHFFRERLGMSFQEFVTRRRLHDAESMLVNTDKNLTTVSRECGFSDPRYLKRAFQAEYGIDLVEYMKNSSLPASRFREPLAVGFNSPVSLSPEDILDLLKTPLQF